MGRFSVEAIFKAVDKLTGPVGKMSAALGKFSKHARANAKALASNLDVGGSALKLGGIAAGAVAVAGAAMKSVADAGMDFEQAITNVGAVSLMSRDEIADLEKKALELGATTKFSATEVANAMEMMGRAGFTNAQTLDGIGGVLAAAAAEGAELADTASTISNVMKGMQLATTESGRVADVLTLASARTNSSITSLGDSMKTLGPVAAQFKIPMEDAVGMVALLQDVGLDASSAGTSAASALTKLAKPSKRAAAQMQKFGISFKDANGNMKPATAIFGEMAKAVQQSGGNMEAAAFFAELVGLESQKAAINLTNAFQSGKAKDLIAELNTAKGSAEAMAKLRMNTLGGDIEQLTGAVETFKIQLYSAQAGPLRGIVQSVTKWIDENAKLSGSGGIGSFISDLIPVVHTFIDAFRGAWPPIQQALSGLMGFGKEGAFLQNMHSFAVRLAEVTALAIGVAAVFGGVVVASLDIVARVVEGVMNAFDWMVAGIGQALFMVSDWFANLGAKWRAGAWEAAKHLISGLVEGMISFAKSTLYGTVANIGGQVLDAFKKKLGIKSPSRPMMTVGVQTAAGLDVGFEKQMRRVNSSMARAIELPAINARSLGTDLAPRRPLAQPPQVASPHARAAHTIEESRQTVRAEVVLKDETGRAEITKKPPANAAVKLRLGQSGAF